MTTTTTIATTDNQRWQQRQRPTTMTTNGSSSGTGSSTVSQVVSCVYSLPVAVNCTPRPFFSFLLLSLVSDMALSIFVRSLFFGFFFPPFTRVLLSNTTLPWCGGRAPPPPAQVAGPRRSTSGAGRWHWQQQRL